MFSICLYVELKKLTFLITKKKRSAYLTDTNKKVMDQITGSNVNSDIRIVLICQTLERAFDDPSIHNVLSFTKHEDKAWRRVFQYWMRGSR